jgi:hypothetical protein
MATDRSVKFSSSEERWQRFGIEAGIRTRADHMACNLRRGQTPYGEERLQSGSCQLTFPVGADVGQKQVAERPKPDGSIDALLQFTRGSMDRCSRARLSAVGRDGGLVCCPCCPFPLGISIYRAERVDAGDLVDSKSRQ